MTARNEEMILNPIGRVISGRHDRAGLPHQGRGSGLEAIIELKPEFEPAAREIAPNDLIWVLAWFHLGKRDKLRGHPQGNQANPEQGVFSLRSPHRPNPIGLTLVEVKAVNGLEIQVTGLEMLDGTPVLDIKPYSPIFDR